MEEGDACRLWLVFREIKKTKDRNEQRGPEDAFSPMPPSRGLKMLASTMISAHDEGNHTDGPIEMAPWDVSRANLHGDARRWTSTYFLQKGKLALLCWDMYVSLDAASSGETCGQKS